MHGADDEVYKLYYAEHLLLNEAADELSAAQSELTAARADAERLDWLEDKTKCYWVAIQRQPDAEHIFSGHGKLIRAAIDEAIRRGGEGERK